MADLLIPKGAIIMWSGEKIPDGWALCDGKDGTPNLVGKFVRGGALHESGNSGGSDQQAFTATTWQHGPGFWSITADYYKSDSGSDARMSPGLNHAHNVNINFDNRPAYFTLVYIIKK